MRLVEPGMHTSANSPYCPRAAHLFPLKHPPRPTQQALDMDSKQFVKLCRDAGLLDSRLTATAADLAFVAKAKPLVRGGRGSTGLVWAREGREGNRMSCTRVFSKPAS